MTKKTRSSADKIQLKSRVNSGWIECEAGELFSKLSKDSSSSVVDVPREVAFVGPFGRDADVVSLIKVRPKRLWKISTESHQVSVLVSSTVVTVDGVTPITLVKRGDLVLTENGMETVFSSASHLYDSDTYVPRSPEHVLLNGICVRTPGV